jgi:hypothetical protein
MTSSRARTLLLRDFIRVQELFRKAVLYNDVGPEARREDICFVRPEPGTKGWLQVEAPSFLSSTPAFRAICALTGDPYLFDPTMPATHLWLDSLRQSVKREKPAAFYVVVMIDPPWPMRKMIAMSPAEFKYARRIRRQSAKWPIWASSRERRK